jgi:hypothetical protein
MGLTDCYRLNPYDAMYPYVFLGLTGGLERHSHLGAVPPLPLLSDAGPSGYCPIVGNDLPSVGSSADSVSSGAPVSPSTASWSSDCNTVHPHRAPRLSHGTLHRALRRRVSFVPYPCESLVAIAPPMPTKEGMARVFIGQLPYQVTDMQLAWLCYTFGNGVPVFFPERIVKHDAVRGTKLPTGCVHAYCNPDAVDALMSGLHKRLLIDDTGVWYATNPAEQEVLSEYCGAMKKDRNLRYPHRPYDTVVAQTATSTFMPRPPTYATFARQ